MSQEQAPPAGLQPVTASQLRGRITEKGRRLILTNPNGAVIVEGALGKAAAPAEATFKAADGTWSVEADGSKTVVVLDWRRKAVATARKGEVDLPSGEKLLWKQASFPTRYRLGDDLWVAKPSRLPVRRFSAELSQAMLNREDRGLLVGIASILTLHVVQLRARRWWIPSGGA